MIVHILLSTATRRQILKLEDETVFGIAESKDYRTYAIVPEELEMEL